jgi:hypothetical protein
MAGRGTDPITLDPQGRCTSSKQNVSHQSHAVLPFFYIWQLFSLLKLTGQSALFSLLKLTGQSAVVPYLSIGKIATPNRFLSVS